MSGLPRWADAGQEETEPEGPWAPGAWPEVFDGDHWPLGKEGPRPGLELAKQLFKCFGFSKKPTSICQVVFPLILKPGHIPREISPARF